MAKKDDDATGPIEQAVDGAIDKVIPDKAPAPVQNLMQEVDAWFLEHFHGTVFGHDTQLWNKLVNAREDLKARVSKFMA